jgi:hypothetical protein
MPQLAKQKCLAAAVVAAAVLTAPGVALGRTAAAISKKPFSGNVCAISISSALGELHIVTGCTRGKTVRKGSNTPLGPVITETSVAHWGTTPKSGPSHYVAVSVGRYTGSSAALASGRHKIEGTIRRQGRQVLSEFPLYSVLFNTSSCVNPPKEDCTHGDLTGLVKNYVVGVTILDAPPTGVGVADPGEDTPQDIAQQELDVRPIVSIFHAIAKKL